VIHLRASQIAVRCVAAALLVAASASTHAQLAFTTLATAQQAARISEATFQQPLDPWSRWTLRLYAQPAGAGELATSAGMEARLLTQRLDTHQLQAGAVVAFSPSAPNPVEAWQAFDDHRPSLFVEDRWQWSPTVSMTAGARLIDSSGSAAFHQRLDLAWQPASAWTLKLTDGALRPASPIQNAANAQSYRGVELRTEQTQGMLRVRASLASGQVSDTVQSQVQSQVQRAAAVTVTLPLDERWSLGSETLIATQGELTRLRLSGTLANRQARFSLVVPHQFRAGPIDTNLSGNLPAVDTDSNLGWRTQLELSF
jgi:hypothetical protein